MSVLQILVVSYFVCVSSHSDSIHQRHERDVEFVGVTREIKGTAGRNRKANQEPTKSHRGIQTRSKATQIRLSKHTNQAVETR